MSASPVLNDFPTGPNLAPRAQALRWIGQPYEFLRECATKFGDVFSLDLGSASDRYVVVSHPDALREILSAEPGRLRVCNSVLLPLLGPASLLLLDGEAHIRDRRVLMPAFQHKAVAGYGEIIRDTTELATKGWADGHSVVAQDLFADISFEVIARVVLGEVGESAGAALKQGLFQLLNDRRLGLGLLDKPMESGNREILGTFWQKFATLRELTRELVSERRAQRSRRSRDVVDRSILSMMLEAAGGGGLPWSDEEIRDEVMTLLVTGHETTATAMTWGLYWIAQRGEVAARIREELSGLKVPLETKEQGQLAFLEATCKEILRIYPIVPALFRQVAERPFALAGHLFDVGTYVSASIYLTHHRNDLYTEPDTFDPTRFLERSYSPYEYLPFGGGARRCIGMHLAMYEMKVVLATLLQRFAFELAPGARTVPRRRFVTVAPSDGVRLLVKSVRP
jgi:cytochrome P450